MPIKEDWASCYKNSKFMPGEQTKNRLESLNGKIKIICSKFASLDTNFSEFFVVLHVLRGERTQSCDAACQDAFDYSLALVKLFCMLSKRQPNLTALRDETLKGRFAGGVRDLHVQREMPWLELDESRISF